MENNNKHKWTENEFRVVCSICQLRQDDEECIQLLSLIFTDCSPFSIKMIVERYNTLSNNTTGWGTNVPKKFKKVWEERDWRR
jgi:hypothetical protein